MRLASRALFWVAVLCFSSFAFASNFSFQGNFILDNDLQEFLFTIANPGTVTMQTWSFAGGTNANGTIIPAGGFAPVLALFDSTGTIVGNFDQGGVAPAGCGPRNIDPVSGFCLDAFLSDSLGAGDYILVLSQQDNVPLSQMLSDGYQHDGDPNFANGFNDFGFPRTSAWAVDIVSVDRASEVTGVPEPCSALALFTGLAWLAGLGLKRNSRR
jgi:hypothetical protein